MFSRTLRLRVPEGTNYDFKKLFRQLKSSCPGLVGIQALGKGSVVDLCFNTENGAHRAAAAGVDYENVHFELKSLAPTLTFVSVFVPIEFADSELKTLLSFYGEIKSVRRLFHKEEGLENLENGCRVLAFSKLAKPLPVRLSYKGISIGFKYTGQPKSCLRCSSFDHLVAECPYKRAKAAATKTQQASPPTPRQAETTTATTSPSESQMEISPSEPSPPAVSLSQAEQQAPSPAQSPAPLAQSTHRKRPLDSPSKGQGKKASLDGFGIFQEDLRARKDNDKLQAVSKDIVLKARAYLLQLTKGDFKEVSSQDAKQIKLQDRQPVFKIWESLQGISSKDSKSELLKFYNNNFKSIYGS